MVPAQWQLECARAAGVANQAASARAGSVKEKAHDIREAIRYYEVGGWHTTLDVQHACAVLRCAVLRCAALCCAVLRCAVLRNATVCIAVIFWPLIV